MSKSTLLSSGAATGHKAGWPAHKSGRALAPADAAIGGAGGRRRPALGLTAERCGRQQGQRALWDVEQYPPAVGTEARRSAVYHLSLYNWAHTSTKWRWLRRQMQGGQSLPGRREDVTWTGFLSLQTLWSKTDKLTHLLCSGSCLHLLFIACNTMVIGRGGRMCIWCYTPPP